MPRGSELLHVGLHVIPHSGGSGAVIAEMRAALYCGEGPLPLSDAELQNYNQTNATIEWDIQPWDLGFATDTSPDLSPLIREALDSRTSLTGCSLVLIITCKEGEGSAGYRSFYSSTAQTKAAELRIIYEPPTSSAQVEWVPDTSCPIDVYVPTTTTGIAPCDNPSDGAAQGKAMYDTNSCPHLSLEVTAATSGTNAAPGGAITSGLHGHAAGTSGYSGCIMSVNGVDLLEGCGMNKLVVGRDGVCAALIDPPNKPRAACFDTKAQGEGADQLAAWIDTLPIGASVMVTSCSRLAWAHNREALATSLASLGALNPPTRIDDAYALVGIKGATAPLSESRTACCESPDPVCHTCDQTVAYASADVACGAAALTLPSALESTPYLGQWASATYQLALGAIGDGAAGAAIASTAAPAPSSLSGVIATLQEEDEEQLDSACDTALADGVTVRYGAQLATDGDPYSYWLSVGRPDAVLTLDLGTTKLVKSLEFDWKFHATSVLVMYSAVSAGTTWEVGASVYQSSTAPTFLSMPGAGVIARRLRVFMADAATTVTDLGSKFGINELVVSSCLRPEVNATTDTPLMYSRHSTPHVLSVSPKRGSTAGGTVLTIEVDAMPTLDISTVSIYIAGTACAVTEVRSTQVFCKTGSYGRTTRLNPGSGLVSMTIAGVGTAAAKADALYEYIDLWSRQTTWGGRGPIPGLETTGDSVWIQQGQRIMLDCNVKLYMVIVQGVLEFDRKDIEVDANYIFIMGGTFTVGTEKDPFLQKALITLHGSPVSQEIPVYGAKTLSCRFCTLDLHGKPLLAGRTHTKLERTVSAGDSVIWLLEPVSWDADSMIAITSTHYNGTFEAFDTAAVVSVANGGYKLTLASPRTRIIA